MCIDITNLLNPRSDHSSKELGEMAKAALALGMLPTYEYCVRAAAKAHARERRAHLARISRRIAVARERIHSALMMEAI